jgi:hypothetical protein
MLHQQLTVPVSGHLQLHVDALHTLTMAPMDCLPKDRMLDLLGHQLHLVRHCMIEHFALEERGGYFQDLRELSREGSESCQELHDQHRAMMKMLTRLAGAVDRGAELRLIYSDVEDLITLVEIHESAERELIEQLPEQAMRRPA